ncbi:MAG TPA: CRTAC1 family protein [Rhodothermales bacterium]|nr:CRTAC1 family protein [Rhodothermales bacterium]
MRAFPLLLAALLLLVNHALAQPAALRFTRITDTPLVTDRASSGAVNWIDFDGDGRLDLFVPNSYDVSQEPVSQANRLYRQGEDRQWTVIPSAMDDAGFSSGSAWADYDNDGDLDAFIPNQRGQDNLLFRNDDGTFAAQPEAGLAHGGASFSATWADIDRDGWLDLFVANGGLSGREPNFYYRNQRDGTFARITEQPAVTDTLQSTGLTFVDMDLDGDSDLFIDGPAPQMYRNDGTGTLVPAPEARFVAERPLLFGTLGSAWGDYDNDGDFDVFMAYGYGEQARLYRNEGAGQFTRVIDDLITHEGHNATNAAWADLDNNGWLDLLIAPWGAPVVIYLNDHGHFTRILAGDLGRVPSFASSLATGDYDNDGDLDVIVGHWPNHPGPEEENHLYRNEQTEGNWLQLDLEGTDSNRSAIGARVVAMIEVEGEVITMSREVRSLQGWRSQHSLTVQLGLGAAQQVQEVRIFWPSGHEQRLVDLNANQRLHIRESHP